MSREWEKAYHWFSREAVPAFGLSPAQISVYNALRDRADGKGITFPSQETIGKESGLGSRAVRVAIKRLEEVGLVEIVKSGRRGGNRYRIGMRPALPETGSRIRNDSTETGSKIRNQERNTGSSIRLKPDRRSDEEDPVKKTHLLGAPPLVAGGDEMLQDFLRIFPRPSDHAKVRDAWDETRSRHPENLLTLTHAYALDRQGKDPQYTARPENWLRRDGWEKVQIPPGLQEQFDRSQRHQAWLRTPEGLAYLARKEPIPE